MGTVIDLQEKVRKKLASKMVSIFGDMYDDAQNVANSYYQLMIKDPSSAIKQLPTFINEIRNLNSDRAFVEAIAGGPNHDWTGPMLDITGIMYPVLEKNVRKEGLLQCLSFLDKLNYFNAQDNVELINEPWLVADIIINRSEYWCGYKQYCDLLKQYIRWVDFSQHIESARSDFWLSLAVTRPKYSSLEVRANFYKQFPDLVDRTKDGIAAITSDHAQHANQKDGACIEDYITKSLSKYDPLLHKDIRDKIKEEKWIKLMN